MAMLSNFPIEDNAYESLLACTSKKQCVPIIDPENFPKSFVVHVNHSSEITINKCKPDNKEASRHSSSARESMQPIAHATRNHMISA